jgi:hypothetical protein
MRTGGQFLCDQMQRSQPELLHRTDSQWLNCKPSGFMHLAAMKHVPSLIGVAVLLGIVDLLSGATLTTTQFVLGVFIS